MYKIAALSGCVDIAVPAEQIVVSGHLLCKCRVVLVQCLSCPKTSGKVDTFLLGMQMELLSVQMLSQLTDIEHTMDCKLAVLLKSAANTV